MLRLGDGDGDVCDVSDGLDVVSFGGVTCLDVQAETVRGQFSVKSGGVCFERVIDGPWGQRFHGLPVGAPNDEPASRTRGGGEGGDMVVGLTQSLLSFRGGSLVKPDPLNPMGAKRK